MSRIASVLATTLLAAGLAAQAFAAELPTSASFNDENASQQDVRRVLGDLGFGNVVIFAQRGRVFDVIADWEGRRVDLRVHSGATGSGWGTITDKTRLAAADPRKMPTSAIFNSADASQQDVRRVLGDLGFGNVQILAQRGRVFDVTADWEGRRVDLRVHSGRTSDGWGTITDKTVMAAADSQEMPTSAIFNSADASRQDVRRVLRDLGFGNVNILAQRGRIFDVAATWQGGRVDLRVHSGTTGSGWGSIMAKSI